MLSIALMGSGQAEYYANLAREDYYLAGGEPPGMWMGKGAEKLGLSGTVERKAFLDLFNGFLDGHGLVQGAGKDRHRPGWDLTFSAPKSVSVAWCQGDRETALEIQAAQYSAVEKALAYLEEQAIWTRRGHAGHHHEQCEAVFATFEHGTSRAQDPQLHTHAILMNVAVREDGTTGTLETQALYEHKMAAGAIYRAELTHQLERRLGFTISQDEHSCFKVDGVSEKLCEEFSKRRQEIEKVLKERGVSSARASEIAALDTRQVKGHVARGELFERWKAVGNEMGWGKEELQGIVKGRQEARECEFLLEHAAHHAVAKFMEKKSYFTERDFTRALAVAAQTIGGGADQVLAKVRDHLQNSQEIVSLGLRYREPIYTTKTMLAMEQDLLDRVEKSRRLTWAGATDHAVEWAFSTRPTIKDEQMAAVRHITQDSKTIATVTGMAGTGKTYMLDATRSVLELSGYRVIGAALAGKAARGLQEEAKIESSTIASLLYRLEKGRPVLDKKTVLVVDEAGMVGTAQMLKLVAAVQEAGAKLVLVGDEKQLQPIEAGGPFAEISKRLGTAALTDIVRQRDEWQRQAVKDFAAGRAEEALEEYASRGLVTVAKDRDAAREELLQAWKAKGMEKPKENLIVTGTNVDAVVLNREIQELRADEGYVNPRHSVSIGKDRLCEGDRVLFTRNSKALGVNNGTLGTVQDVNLLGFITVRLDNDETKTFSTWRYSHLKLGYAFTTHKTQGMTAENVFVLTSESMQDRELSYVQASRVKGEARFFTTEAEAGLDLQELARSMARSRQKELAINATREPEQGRGQRAVLDPNRAIEHELTL